MDVYTVMLLDYSNQLCELITAHSPQRPSLKPSDILMSVLITAAMKSTTVKENRSTQEQRSPQAGFAVHQTPAPCHRNEVGIPVITHQ